MPPPPPLLCLEGFPVLCIAHFPLLQAQQKKVGWKSGCKVTSTNHRNGAFQVFFAGISAGFVLRGTRKRSPCGAISRSAVEQIGS